VFKAVAINLMNTNKIISIVRFLKEDGAPTNSVGGGGIAGLPPDQPPVDLRKKNTKGWNIFFKDLVRRNRKKKRKS